jgi:hypothetical protein
VPLGAGVPPSAVAGRRRWHPKTQLEFLSGLGSSRGTRLCGADPSVVGRPQTVNAVPSGCAYGAPTSASSAPQRPKPVFPGGRTTSAGRKRRGKSDWGLVQRRQPVFRIGDDFAQDRFRPRIFREPQRDPKPNDPRPKPTGFVFR